MTAFARFLVGDSLTVLRTLPDASVDLVLTSPPFLALRSYLPADDPNKPLEMGSEATPGAFIDALLDVVEECRRVLAPHGSLCFELGDTYAGSGGAGGDYGDQGLRAGQPMFRQGYVRNDRPNRPPQEAPKAAGKPKNNRFSQPDAGPRTGPGRSTAERDGWPLDKSLCLIPESFRWALVYGRNPFTGRETPRWRARNVVRWCRPNPPVGALADKFRPGTSDMVVACVGRKRYFDLDAVRYAPTTTHARAEGAGIRGITEGGQVPVPLIANPAGAPPLDWWEISTQPYEGSHYATWPEKLLDRPIEAMCPRRVCTECGQPSERIARTTNAIGEAAGRRSWRNNPSGIGAGHAGDITRSISTAPTAERETLGWTDCGHDAWRTGIVLDPFAGSGTTLAVALGHGRHAIGIDLDHRNADLARQRVGLWLEVDEPAALAPADALGRRQ